MCIVYSSFLGHQTSLIAFFAQTAPSPRGPDEGFPIFGTKNLGGVVLAATGTCILFVMASPPRLTDSSSNSRSGDSADRQVACDSKPWQRRLGRPSNSLRAPACRW